MAEGGAKVIEFKKPASRDAQDFADWLKYEIKHNPETFEGAILIRPAVGEISTRGVGSGELLAALVDVGYAVMKGLRQDGDG